MIATSQQKTLTNRVGMNMTDFENRGVDQVREDERISVILMDFRGDFHRPQEMPCGRDLRFTKLSGNLSPVEVLTLDRNEFSKVKAKVGIEPDCSLLVLVQSHDHHCLRTRVGRILRLRVLKEVLSLRTLAICKLIKGQIHSGHAYGYDGIFIRVRLAMPVNTRKSTTYRLPLVRGS